MIVALIYCLRISDAPYYNYKREIIFNIKLIYILYWTINNHFFFRKNASNFTICILSKINISLNKLLFVQTKIED